MEQQAPNQKMALSITESEYIALSSATREILSLRRVLQDIVTHSYINLTSSSSQPDNIHSNLFASQQLPPSKIYEDNNACIVLATTATNFKPRTKHTSLKYHHFHDQVKKSTLSIVKVDTTQNWADILYQAIVQTQI